MLLRAAIFVLRTEFIHSSSQRVENRQFHWVSHLIGMASKDDLEDSLLAAKDCSNAERQSCTIVPL